MIGWTIKDWQDAYKEGATPESLLGELLTGLDETDVAWISLLDQQGLSKALAELEQHLQHAGGDRNKLPLYGIPFAAKDNIDAAGFETTAACPAFAFSPKEDASTVARLKAAGAVVIGKTNLDQFATGLVGTRSPYGAVPNSFKPEVVSGGSSSGSASVVA
ncbi:allophanate hydrolase, partial [Marinobacter sp. B9-2]